MGLREKKAERTRDRIVSAALSMFTEQGYAETTMESIAEAVEIHPATLYRYFPSKDLIVLADFASTAEHFAKALEDGPDDVPLDAALMQAIVAVFEREDAEHLDRRLLRSIIDQAPAARARVWDLQAEQRARIAAVIARRTGARPEDLDVIVSARIVVLIVETAADVWRDTDGARTETETARDIVRLLAEGRLLLPDPRAAANDESAS